MKISNGSGSWEKRKSTWYLRKDYGYNDDGKRIVKRFSGKTKRDVLEKVAAFEKPILLFEGKSIQPTDDPFGKFLMDWLTSVKKLDIKSTTYDSLYHTIQNRILVHGISTVQINLITSDDIRAFLNDLIDKKYSKATVDKTYNTMNNCFNFAVSEGLIQNNPMRNVKKPAESAVITKAKEISFFSLEDVKRLEEISTTTIPPKNFFKYQYGDEIMLLIYSGVRIGDDCVIIGLNRKKPVNTGVLSNSKKSYLLQVA